MDDGIKQRLIGAVVLVLLMVIFLPMLFTNNELEPAEVLVEIPEKPPLPAVKIEEHIKPSEQRKAELKPLKPQPKETVEELASKQFDQNDLPVSWVLQVASFREQANAEKLRDKLRDAGYKAYTKYRSDVEPKMIRVMVGPVLERSEAEKIKASIAERHKLDGVVVRYLP